MSLADLPQRYPLLEVVGRDQGFPPVASPSWVKREANLRGESRREASDRLVADMCDRRKSPDRLSKVAYCGELIDMAL